MPMEGSSEEYEKLTLAALKKAASPDSDASYHNNRAAIFASLAMAAASAEMAESLKQLSTGGAPLAASPPRGQRPAAAQAQARRRSAPADAATAPPPTPDGATPGTAIVPRASG